MTTFQEALVVGPSVPRSVGTLLFQYLANYTKKIQIIIYKLPFLVGSIFFAIPLKIWPNTSNLAKAEKSGHTGSIFLV